MIVTYRGECKPGTTIELPPSKSVMAREMMLAAYYDQPVPVQAEDACSDLKVLYQALTTVGECVNVGESGTAYRFLVSWLSLREGRHILTGSSKLLQRPLTPLVNALRSLGGHIEESPEGLIIRGEKLRGGVVEINSSESSQYVSSLMLLAPRLPGGLTIKLTGDRKSAPYISMTTEILRQGGVEVTDTGNEIAVSECGEITLPVSTERDWSAASYFFEVMSLTGCLLRMPGLKPGLQGDAGALKLFSELPTDVNMGDVPDLVPAYAATLCGLRRPFRITGIGHLKYKESNRLATVSEELRNLGYNVTAGEDSLQWDGRMMPPRGIVKSHNDHRIVMALAPLAAVHKSIEIEGAEAVDKSFPDYFKQLIKAGYSI